MYYTIPAPIHVILDFLIAPLIYLAILPCALTLHTFLYVLNPPSYPGWTFKRYMDINFRRTRQQCYAWRRLPIRDPEVDIIPPMAQKYMKESEVVKICCPALKDSLPRVGVLQIRRDLVKSLPGTCFMIQQRDGHAKHLTRHATPGERIIYFMVGGGYVGGHPLRIHTPWSLGQLSGARVFCVNYRKSLSEDTAFPASLLDCLAGYQYLVEDLGFVPHNIMLCGDSAGANACLALAKYLGDLEDSGFTSWSQVGSMCLHSSWADMTSSFPSISSNLFTDHLIDVSTVHVPSHTRYFPNQTHNAYFSPALTPSGGFAHLVRHGVKVYISYGTAEKLRDEIVALGEGMKRDGVDLTIRALDGATHSDLVWLDRDWPVWMGWSWKIVKDDFVRLWKSTG